MDDEYQPVGRDYECDMCLENKVLNRLCDDCFWKIIHNHLIQFQASGLTPQEYMDKQLKKDK